MSTMQASMRVVPQSLRFLLDHLVDYAGLFPPARLGLTVAVRKYARYLAGENSWALGNFVLPSALLPDFEHEQVVMQPSEEWKLSALPGNDLAADMSQIESFNARNAGRAHIDSIEIKAATAEDVRRAKGVLSSGIVPYYEVVPAKTSELLPVIREVGGRAKIRTGGISADAIPTIESVADFIAACAKEGVPFKATAGLHHPIRGVNPLTYQPDAPTAMMHGFLNVFLCAVMARENAAREQLLEVLSCGNRSSFAFAHDGAVCKIHLEREMAGHVVHSSTELNLATESIRATRQKFALSFGSCSFEEPVADLRELGFL